MIADMVGVSESTVSRELKRNTGQRGYSEKQAQRRQGVRKKTGSTKLRIVALTVGWVAYMDVSGRVESGTETESATQQKDKTRTVG